MAFHLTFIVPLSFACVAAGFSGALTSQRDPRFQPFFRWLESRGASLGPIRLDKSRIGDGNGCFLTNSVEENDVIATIPEAACVKIQDVVYSDRLDIEVREKLAELVATSGQGGATVALAILLVKEWLCEKETGPWGPYLCMLPWDAKWPPEGEQEQEHILWWSDAQVMELDDKEAFEDAQDLRIEVNKAVKVAQGLIGKPVREAYKKRDGFWASVGAEDDINKATRGAFVSLLTRSFQQGDSNFEETRLVPLLDMLQHSAEENTRQVREEVDGLGPCVVLRAKRPMEAGEELLNTYADLPPHLWLTRFGFVPGKRAGEFRKSLKDTKQTSWLPFGK